MELYKKLELEFQELNQKIQKLKTFLESKEYSNLGDNQQFLLYIQHEAMRTYGSCLVSRMKDIILETKEK